MTSEPESGLSESEGLAIPGIVDTLFEAWGLSPVDLFSTFL